MRRLFTIAFALGAAPLFAGTPIATRCDVETTKAGVADVRRLGTCADDKTTNALWHLDRLDSGDGHLDGHYTPVAVHALVYVIDIGIEKDHSEFSDGNIIGGIDVAPKGATPSSCTNPALHPCISPSSLASVLIDSHGTGVASMIGGRRVGVAPGASIVSVYTGGGGAASVFLNAFNKIIEHAWDPATPQVKTAIVNMSNQLPQVKPTPVAYVQLENKMRDMTIGVDRDGNRDPNGKRFLFTVAGGNAAAPSKAGADRGQCGPDYEVILFPASLGASIPGVITVGGTAADNTMWVDSCRGAGIELFAPADDIFAAINTGNDQYRLTAASGTSWSAPIVAGVAARLLTENPDLTPAELEAKLEASPTAITTATDGPSGGRVVFVGAPPIPHRRATRH